ncbi:hypothetical protein OQA88_1138 [Cercophora sp. LCS_1]
MFPRLTTFLTLFTLLTSTLAAKIRSGADPTIIKLDNVYYSAESAEGGIWVRSAPSLNALANPTRRELVWSDTAGLSDVWAPEITTHNGRTYIHFSAGRDAAHRMYVISADTPLGRYSSEKKLALPDDQWAIDGIFFTFEGKGWFVWSGWESETKNSEQTLYICAMNDPETPVGGRHVISQPREEWERGDRPYINEGPEAIVDPEGRLHIVYSANGSWGERYCLADLRLRKGGDPTYVWDWYKSNGCLFGSRKDRLMQGWDETLFINGPGHHTFVLEGGDVGKSPGGDRHIEFAFHGVEKGTEYSWGNRSWFSGSFVWWGGVEYGRRNVPGPERDTGYGFKFFE